MVNALIVLRASSALSCHFKVYVSSTDR